MKEEAVAAENEVGEVAEGEAVRVVEEGSVGVGMERGGATALAVGEVMVEKRVWVGTTVVNT